MPIFCLTSANGLPLIIAVLHDCFRESSSSKLSVSFGRWAFSGLEAIGASVPSKSKTLIESQFQSVCISFPMQKINTPCYAFFKAVNSVMMFAAHR